MSEDIVLDFRQKVSSPKKIPKFKKHLKLTKIQQMVYTNKLFFFLQSGIHTAFQFNQMKTEAACI